MADNRPATIPTWSTDTNFGSGPETGTPTKVAPASGTLAQGLVPGAAFIGPYANWLLNLLCGWVYYLSDLPNQTQFLNKAFSWTGSHTFSSLINAASMKLSGTVYAGNIGARTDLSGDVLYTDGSGSPSYYTRNFMHPLVICEGGPWYCTPDGAYPFPNCNTIDSSGIIPIRLPQGCYLQTIVVKYNQGKSTTVPAGVSFRKVDVNGVKTVIASANHTTAAGKEDLTLTINQTLANDFYYYYLNIGSGEGCDSTHPDYVVSVKATFRDYGPGPCR